MKIYSRKSKKLSLILSLFFSHISAASGSCHMTSFTLLPFSIPLAALLAVGTALRLEFGAEGLVRRRRACGL
jgi:hypothetical protein